MSTIRDVAKLAEVSIATVSRVLNNDTTYRMTGETRERVWKAIADLNYKAPATQHKRGASNVPGAFRKIGCIVNLRGGKYTDPYYLSLLSGIESYFSENRSEVAFVRTWTELEDSETLIRTFSEPLDGLIVMSHLNDATFRYAQSKVPFIVGIDTGYREIDNIEYDHEQAAQMAVTYLYEKQFREIGFIGGSEGKMPMKQCRRYHTYLNTMLDLGLSIKDEWVLDCDWNDVTCTRLVERLGRDHLPRSFSPPATSWRWRPCARSPTCTFRCRTRLRSSGSPTLRCPSMPILRSRRSTSRPRAWANPPRRYCSTASTGIVPCPAGLCFRATMSSANPRNKRSD